jgi:hypothetical protein
MGSRVANRSARLVLAAAAAAGLTTAAAATAGAATTAGADDSSNRNQTGSTIRIDDEKQACITDDLTFSVSTKTQAGGYFLVTAKAKPGVTCYLEGTIPSASFGAGTGNASPAEQAVTDPVKLSGSTAAYAGISPKSTNNDEGTESDRLRIAVAGDEADTVTVQLPEPALVDKPITTNWHADPADAVPFTN